MQNQATDVARELQRFLSDAPPPFKDAFATFSGKAKGSISSV
jgi:hypothetical protein